MLIRKIILVVMLSIMLLSLVGCGGTVNHTPTPQEVMKQQNDDKLQQATEVMDQVKVPKFKRSIERENIHDRLVMTNDPNTLQWIYPVSNGRVIGRFTVRGKVTSGSKRLTSPVMKDEHYDLGSNGTGDYYIPAPDESGAYGDSGDYIFWFDPAKQIHQWKGQYLLSPVPYKIEQGYGTVSVEIDITEQAKTELYDQQTKKVGGTK